jgi:hypothetical protein
MHNAQKTFRRGTLHKEMQQALVESAIRYRDAVRRFQDYRRPSRLRSHLQPAHRRRAALALAAARTRRRDAPR